MKKKKDHDPLSVTKVKAPKLKPLKQPKPKKAACPRLTIPA